VGVYNEKILVVDGEEKIRQALATRLTSRGYRVILASDGEKALSAFKIEQPNLIVLDILLPKIDGYELCRKIREKSQVPIIILTSLNTVTDRVTGLNLGADDYLVKPFSPKELEARIRAVLRRSTSITRTQPTTKKQILNFGNVVIDLHNSQILKNDLRIKLTTVECNLLELLIENAGKELSRNIILDNIWGYTPQRDIDTRVVDVYVSRLRAKLEEDSSNPILLLTVRKFGYMFQDYL
jgi:OmpR family response regulator RpaB